MLPAPDIATLPFAEPLLATPCPFPLTESGATTAPTTTCAPLRSEGVVRADETAVVVDSLAARRSMASPSCSCRVMAETVIADMKTE